MEWANIIFKAILLYNKFVLIYFFVINIIYTLFIFLSFWGLYIHLKRAKYGKYYEMVSSPFVPPISLLVPCYNEEKTIVQNVYSLMQLEYGEFEIIIINDGSKDQSLDTLIEAFSFKKADIVYKKSIHTQEIKGIYTSSSFPNLILMDKENGGKADALNAGINLSKYPLFTAIDADSVLEKNSLIRIIRPFMEEPEKVVAAGGIVRIVNGCVVKGGFIKEIDLPKNTLAMFQTVEYLRAFLTGRVGWSMLNGLLIISGAFGVFKKEMVISIGGYTSDTIGEDMELIVKIHRLMKEQKKQYKIVFVPDPVCWTQAPENINSLFVQRKRWHRGLMDSLISHRDMFLNPKYGFLGMVAIPYYWFFEMIGPIIEITGYISILFSFLTGNLNMAFSYLFFIFALLYGIFISTGSILLEEFSFQRYKKVSSYLKLIFYSIIENFGYRQMITLWRFISFFGYRVKQNKWGIIERKKFNK